MKQSVCFKLLTILGLKLTLDFSVNEYINVTTVSTDYKRVLWDHRGQGAGAGWEERRCGQDEQVRLLGI